ncbi:MAG: DUF1361 domain-containing protein [Candidatus Saccharimonadales bacterium]
MKSWRLPPQQRVMLALAGMTAISLGFYLVGMAQNHSSEFSYMAWNLFLAWIPLTFSIFLVFVLKTRLWSNWLPLLLTLLWLVFLPNTFYMISDFIHIQDVVRHDLLYDIVMFTSFIFTAALIGFISLYQVHAELIKRLGLRLSSSIIMIIIFLCSFAIYLGRDLRWNSWDVLLNPAAILFDVSDRIIHPLGHSGAIMTTLSFFILIGGLYVVFWQISEAARHRVNV